MRKWIRFILKRTWLILALGLVLTAVFTFFARRLHIDNSVRTGFPSHNRDFQELEAFLREFGGDELIVVAYRSDEIFSNKHLLAIDSMSREIAGLDMVMKVTSLTEAPYFESYQGKLRPVNLIARSDEGELVLPEDKKGFEELRGRVLDNSLYVDNIISRDGTATAVAAHLKSNPGDDSYKSRLTGRIKEVARTSGLDVSFHFAGPPVFVTEMERCVSHDLRYFTPVVIVMIGILLFFLFRSWRSVLLPLLTVIMCVLWIAGFMQLSTGRITIASTILPPLMIAIGVAIVVHVFAQYEDELRINIERRPALEEAITHVGWPCLLTALTTAIGFASLSVSEIPTIIETGLFAAFGVMAAYLIAMTFVPAVLLHTKVSKRPVETVHPSLVKGLRAIGRFNETRPRLVVLITILLVVASVWGMTRLEVETNLINYFSPKTEVRRAQDFVSDNLGGSITMDVVIEAGEGGTVADIELLKRVDELEAHLRTYPEVGKVYSIADVVLAMNKERFGEQKFFEELPFIGQENLKSIRNMRSEYGNFKHDVDEDFTKLRVSARLHQMSSKKLLKMLQKTEDYLAKHFKGLIAMVPNVVPIMITLAVMGFAGIPINVTTAMIPCIALGIAVDDTIHYVSRFKREFAQDSHYVNSMFRTLLSTGKPIVFTSIILFCGFITLAVSSFSCNAYFGILTSITMISALLGDLVILPVLMNILRPIRKRPEESDSD